MTIFDRYITDIIEYVEEAKRNNGQVRTLYIPSDYVLPSSLLSPNEDHGSGANIVLKSETFLELGGPMMGSCAMIIYTNDADILTDGEITLIGPDIGEAESSALPFGQAIMVAGEELGDDDYYKLLRYANISDLVNGYMVKSTLENVWSRVSYKAAESGFNFKRLGAAIARRIKTDFLKVDFVSILFVTSDKEDVSRLHQIVTGVRGDAQKIKEKIWKRRGVNLLECGLEGHCGLCKDRSACERIKKTVMANE
jgi:hypothetical protein